MPLLAHAPSQFMMLLGSAHLLSVPVALASAVLLAWPGRHRHPLAKGLAVISLLMPLPVLVILPILPSLLGSTASEAMALLLVSPSLSVGVLMALKRWSKK